MYKKTKGDVKMRLKTLKNLLILSLGGVPRKQINHLKDVIESKNLEIDRLNIEIDRVEDQLEIALDQIDIDYKNFHDVLNYQGDKPEMATENPVIEAAISAVTTKYEILDELYTIPTLKQLQDFLAYDKVSKKEWTNEDYDCDNFAVDLWANAKSWDTRIALGFCTVTLKDCRHAINIGLVDDNGTIKLVYIEPQNDVIYYKYPRMRHVDNVVI